MQIELALYSKYLKKLNTNGLIYFFGAETLGHQNHESLIDDKYVMPHIEIVYNNQSHPTQIKLYRPLISSEEIYFAIDNDLINISNYFKHALLSLQKEKRTINEVAIVDHFLFRAVPGKNTYCENVKRVGNGEEITINLADGTYQEKQISRLEKKESTGTKDMYIERVNSALEKEIQKIEDSGNSCLLFSGGVDSSVIASYLPEQSLVSYQITSAEFKPDAVYAEEGAEILNRKLDVITTDEKDFFKDLENTIDALAMPPHHSQTVLMANGLKKTPFKTYIVGQSADGLFGLMLPRDIKYGFLFKHKVLRNLASLLARFLKKYRFRINDLVEKYEALSKPVNSVEGYALNFARPCPPKLLYDLFGRDLVNSRIEARYEYMKQIGLPDKDGSSLIDHIETGHVIDFFGEDTGTVWHQLAKSQNKEILRPFATKNLMNTAYSIPAKDRYFSNGVVKYILKELLQIRMPTYPANRKKLGGVLPLKRYFMTDMFENEFKEYELPEFLSEEILKRNGNKSQQFLWHAISYIIWENRILKSNTMEKIEIQPDERWTWNTEDSSQLVSAE